MRWRRGVSCLTLGAFLGAACTQYRWRAIPVTEVSLEQEKVPSRRVRMFTDSGTVTMQVRGIVHPYLEGVPEPGTGLVTLDVRKATRADEITSSGKEGLRLPVSLSEAALSALVAEPHDLSNLKDAADKDAPAPRGRLVSFETAEGPVVLALSRVAYPFVEGEPWEGTTGSVRVDLRKVDRMEIHEVHGSKTALAVIGGGLGTFAVGLAIIALTKESCPFVYVDRGNGFELIGEAYAGAAFRSIQRDDLLPLPAVPSGRLPLRLRNEARETQYTDRAELVLVEHRAGVRALATFDGRVVLVGPSTPPSSAVDPQRRDVTDRVAVEDGQLWQTDLVEAADAPHPALSESLSVAFESPPLGSQPVLELVLGTTPWLDLTFNRFFAAMGDRLGTYLDRWNRPTAGPGLSDWEAREGVTLTVEVHDGHNWRAVGVVPPVGPVATRRVALPLPVMDGSRSVLVRMRGGLGFWRIDQVALSSTAGSEPRVLHAPALSAHSPAGGDQRPILAAADGRYDVLEAFGDSLDLAFEVPAPSPGWEQSAFLSTSGYYNVHPPIQPRWSPGTLRALGRDPGSLSRFSLDLAREYVRVSRATPDPFAAHRSGP